MKTSDEKEKWKNLVLFKAYATDKELDAMFPSIMIWIIIFLVVYGIYYFFGK